METFQAELQRVGQGGFSAKRFAPVRVGAFEASIQASEYHYSEPRVTLPSGEDYTRFEIALFEVDGDKWISPTTDARFQGKPWAGLFEDGGSPVAGYVDAKTVAQILADLRETK
jgi:hypothetical protein